MKLLTFTAVFLYLQVSVFALTKEEVQRELNNLISETTAETRRAYTNLTGLAQGIQDLSENVIGVGTQQIDRQSQRFSEQVNIIEKSAEAEHVNVTACTKSNRGILVELSELSKLLLDSCVNRFTDQGLIPIQNALGSLRVIDNEVFALEKRLEACSTTGSCLDLLLTEVKRQEIDIPRRIAEQEDTAQTKSEANRLYLSTCGVKSSEELMDHGLKIISAIQTCVDKLIVPPSA